MQRVNLFAALMMVYWRLPDPHRSWVVIHFPSKSLEVLE
ncbi:hypothetical protein NOC27_937 [Nitrosococcus oceani AFC27]|nr:hypothetical protein NOC27_937 [Nitrosococcus oceani AFC27]